MKKYYFIAAAALTLAACSSDESVENNAPVAATFTANIENSQATRAYDTTWEDGDAIGITPTNNSLMTAKYANIKYTTSTNSLGNFTDAGTKIYFQDPNTVGFQAYYPFYGTNGTSAATISNISTDATAQNSQKTIDYLWATTSNISESNPKVTFAFSHKMSKIELTFTVGDDIDISKITSYTIKGLKQTGTFDTTTGTATATGSAADLTIQTTSATSNKVIVFPQDASSVTLSVTVDSQVYSCTITPTSSKLEAGKNYVYSIKVSKTGLTVSNCSISGWTSGSNTETTAEM